MKPDRLSQKLKKAFFKENGGRTSINYSDAFAGNDQKNQGRRNNSRNDSLTESKSETTVQSPKPKNKDLSNKERRAFDAKSRQLPDAVAKNLFRFKTPKIMLTETKRRRGLTLSTRSDATKAHG